MSKFSVEKGKRYERKIANILSDWSGIELVRTPDGAPEDLYADIWPKNITDYFPLAVECKHEEDWSFDQVIKGTGPMLVGTAEDPSWLEQAERQAYNARRVLLQWYEPVLVFTKNRFPDMVVVGWERLRRTNCDPTVPRVIIRRPVIRLGIGMWMDTEEYYIAMILDEFLASVSFEDMQRACTFYWCVD